MLEIQHSTIETLVGLISLDDLPHDPDRVFGAQRGR
jgi:hypothetical protein